MRTLTTILDAVGAALMVGGVALVYIPGAVVLAGLALLFVSYRLAGGA